MNSRRRSSGTYSAVAPRYPNEWELFARHAFVQQDRGARDLEQQRAQIRRVLPPLLACLGTLPSQAANCRPFLNSASC